MSQLGLILVGMGADAEGFSLIDEAMAGALAGEAVEPRHRRLHVLRHAQRLRAGERRRRGRSSGARSPTASSTTYGCPFLYAECRISYGSVLTATGRWIDADREMRIGLRITEGACPALHRRALARLGRAAHPPGPARGRRATCCRAGGALATDDRGGRCRCASSSPRATPRPPAACSSDEAQRWTSTVSTRRRRSTCSSRPTWRPGGSTRRRGRASA